MPRKIGDKCVSCGSCEPECPVNAISKGRDTFLIAFEECINCGACEAVCPANAITEVDEDGLK